MRGHRRVGAAVLGLAVAVAAPALAVGRGSAPKECNWAHAGFDVRHSFSVPVGCTSISRTTVPTLTPKWFVHTKDSVTASPVVDDGTLYVGSWDGTFYAVDTATGTVRWTFHIHTHANVAFGRIVSTATVASFADPSAPTGSRRVVIFGGGSALWALDAATGEELTHIDLDPRDAAARAADGSGNETVEVESSPVLAPVRVGPPGHRHHQRRIYVGLDVHDNDNVGRTGLVALRLVPGTPYRFRPIWKFDPETSSVYAGRTGLTVGSGEGFGCGGVWSSPALVRGPNLVVFGSASCDHPEDAQKAGENWSEQLWAIHADSGALAWSFRPAKTIAEAHLDDDFGAMPNVFTTKGGHVVVGGPRKDACYYARDAKTGAAVWQNCDGTAGNLSDGFGIGGYLGTPAVERDAAGHALRVIGATAIPVPHSTSEAVHATALVRAINPATGKTLWTYRLGGPTYASTTIAGGVAFVPDTFTSSLIALDTANGVPLDVQPLVGPPSSAPAVVGSSVYVTTGTRETDLEYKAFGLKVQQLEAATGSSPLSPVSGIYRCSLAGG